MTVRDLATLARRIISDFPDYFAYYSEREFEYAGIKQPNRNPLLQAGVPGVDGMKTGFTDGAGYGLVATAQRDERRIISVMAGLDSAGQRRTEGERLLEYGFREFQEYRLFEPGAVVARPMSGSASQPTVPLTVDRTVAAHPCPTRRARIWWSSWPSTAPSPHRSAKGQEIGRIEVTAPGSAPSTAPLVAAADVARAGVLGRATECLSYLIWGAPAT